MESNFYEILPSFESEASDCQEADSKFGMASEFPKNIPQPLMSKIIFTNYPHELSENNILIIGNYSWVNRHLFFDALTNKVPRNIIVTHKLDDFRRLKEIISEIKTKTGKSYKYIFQYHS